MTQQPDNLMLIGATKAMPLASVRSWRELLGTEDDATALSVHGAYSAVPFVYRGVDVRAKAVQKMPLMLTRRGGKADLSTQSVHAPLMALIRSLLYLTEAGLCVYGASYLIKEVNQFGKNLTPRWLLPTTVTPWYDQTTLTLTHFDRIAAGRQYRVPVDQMITVWLPTIGSEIGAGVAPVAVALRAAGVLHNVDSYLEHYFAGGAVKATLLQVEGNPPEPERKKLEAWWKRVASGVKAVRHASAVSAKVNPIVIGDSLKDTVNKELTAQEREDIATALGVPHSLMMSNAATFATAQQDWFNFYDQTVIAQADLIVRAFNEQWLTDLGLQLILAPEQLEAFQYAETQKASAIQQLVGKPILTVNEGRELLGYDPLPEESTAEPDPNKDEPTDDESATKHHGGGHNQQRHAWRFGGGGMAAEKLDAMPKDERAVYHQRLGERVAKQSKGGGGALAVPTKQETGQGENAKTKAFGSDPNKVYEFRHRVVELDDLVTSNTQSGAVNPAYTQELQPRDRSRAASQNQIDQVAKNLTPEAMLLDFHQIDKGSPIVGGDMMVESGNGRTMALRRAKDMHPEKWQEYQQKARDHAEKLGIDPREFDGKKNPVIVRERLGDDDRVAFAREANAPPVLQMSTLETAQVDSRRLKDSDALSLKVREDQTIDQALRSRDNQDFVQRFMQTLPANDRASLMRSDGTLNQMGIYRMKGALFTRAFPGDAGGKVAESFLESVDSNVKHFENSVAATLPGLSRARSLTSSGQRYSDLDMSDDFATAIHVYSRIKDQNRFSVDDYLGQGSMFDRETTPRQDRILKHFDKIGRQPTKIKRFLQRYIDEIEKSPEPGQGSMFGDDDRPTKDQILDRLLQDED